MCCKSFLLGGALFALSAGSLASAQVQSSALTDATPWSYNFLPSEDAEMPASSWAVTDTEQILEDLKEARTNGLSPAERLLLRRLVLSSADAPEGETADTLLSERARVMLDLGEARAAARLLPELEIASDETDLEALAIDLRMGLGENDAACQEGIERPRPGAYWARLRAICYAMTDDAPAAELAVELAASEGVTDPWLARVVFYAIDVLDEKPDARLDDGLNLSVSGALQLQPSETDIASSRKDLATAIARSDNFMPAFRAQAAGAASEAGLLDAGMHRSIYDMLVAEDDFNPRTPLEVAMVTSARKADDPAARARAVRAALRTARGKPARFAAVSRLLMEDIKSIPRSETTERMSQMFALASLAADETEEMTKWAAVAEDDDDISFAQTWVHALSGLASEDLDLEDQSAAMASLLATADQDDTRAASARLLTLWSAFDISLQPEARAFLAMQNDPAANLPAYQMRAILAAAEAGAASEVVLSILKLTDGDPYKLHPADTAMLCEALQLIGQEDAARLLALEATGYWRRAL